MKKKFPLIIVFICLIAAGCKAESPGTTDYIIFGDFYGMCSGSSCVDYYKIENGSIFKDQLDEYPDGSINHNFTVYTGGYTSSMLDVSTELPSGIYSEGEIIGMPDAYDQGGLYIEISDNGNIQNWRIDKDHNNVPPYLHTLCDSVEHYLSALD